MSRGSRLDRGPPFDDILWLTRKAFDEAQRDREDVTYAVFRTGGKQFRAEPGERLKVPTLAAGAGDAVTFEDVLLLSDGEAVKVGRPTVKGASVKAEVLGHGRGKKVIVFKRKRRKGYRRKQGHRQNYTEIQVDEILG